MNLDSNRGMYEGGSLADTAARFYNCIAGYTPLLLSSR